MITGKTKVCGLIGYPVAHSMSPFIHGRLAGILGEDLAYVTFPVRPGEVNEAVKGALALGICGLNVTVPHKESVKEALSELDDNAKKVGAVNTLVRTDDGGFKGYNTDVTGLDMALDTHGIEVSGRNTVIIGAGGAARAAAVLCAGKGAGHIFIMNRNRERAAALSDHVNAVFGRNAASPLGIHETGGLPREKMIVFQATSAGLYPDVDNVPTEDEELFARTETVFDLIYTPLTTRFMKLAEERGAKAYNGLWMLVWQAVSAFELWTGKNIERQDAQVIYDDMIRVMKEG
ncbi:MAG: shikimate dehydrogenase [Lachnospiraceae bacterium]|nr:shikimate dehydrogenase [Lachnospiraceae bacterium]